MFKLYDKWACCNKQDVMQNDYGKRIVLPCHKHVRCDNVIFSFKCYYPNCSDMSSAPFERFGGFFPSRFVQKNSFKPAHLLIASYPVEWQSTPGCQPLRPNPLDCVRLHIGALWTRAPTVFQCCNVVQVPSKSKTLPDAGVLWALPPQPHWMKCSVLEPWFTRRACDHRHSCINLWPRCTLKQKPTSACTFPRFPLYCMPAEAVPLVSGHYEKKDRLRCREGWNCRQSHRRDAFHCLMTLRVLRWEENSFEITNTSTPRSRWFGVDGNAAEVCTDNLSLAERNYFVCTPSQATAIGCIYIFRGETSVLDKFLCSERMLRSSCWALFVDSFNAREDILCFKKWFALTATKQQSGMTCRICENTSFFSSKWQVWHIYHEGGGIVWDYSWRGLLSEGVLKDEA